MDTKRVVSFGAASLAVFTLGALGCNALVSAGDYHVEGIGSDATVDSFVPEPDTGADQVAVEDAGHETGPGADADAEAGPACGSTIPTTTADFKQLVKACVLHVGCNPFAYYGGTTIAQCIATSSLNAFGATACESTAQNCNDVSACNGVGWASECDGGAHTAFCDGANHAVTCENANDNYPPGIVNDCTKNGGTCRVYDGGTSGPVADCLVTACSDTDGQYHCKGNLYYTCVGDAGYGENCQQYQATCADLTDSGPSCYYNLPACPSGGATACDTNDVGQVCFSDTNQLGRFHCGAAGLKCDPTQDPATLYPFQCKTPGCSAADEAACVEGCNGNLATFCVGGAKVTFDCASVTGTPMTCHQLSDNSQPPIQYAQCQPVF